MVCIICYDPLLGNKNPNNNNNSNSNRASSLQSRRQPAALNCGHVFHKNCINRWFSTNRNRPCPLCHNEHYGPVLCLFIDADDGNNSTSNNNSNNGASGSNGRNNNNNNNNNGNGNNNRQKATSKKLSQAKKSAVTIDDIDRLCECFDELGMDAPEQESYMSLDEYFQELLDELVFSSAQLVSRHEERSRTLSDRIDELEDDLAHANENGDYQMSEIARLNKLSDAHRTHIASLQNALERRKDIIEYYEDRYGDYY
ncbi:hypothetical protein H4S06_002070 [Coemansia sp. BCRC 34490]|nr:hypothetical protein H4S06_002070 [Coemansia sp. BCRC 34490]